MLQYFISIELAGLLFALAKKLLGFCLNLYLSMAFLTMPWLLSSH